MSASSLKSLKQQCRALGLSTSGKKADLVGRLDAHQTPEATAHASPPDSENDDENAINCLLAVPVPPSSTAEMIQMARAKFLSAAPSEPFQEEELLDKPVITNPRGGSLLTAFRDKMRAMDDKLDELRAELYTKTDELRAELYTKTDELQRTSAGFRDFRHRFISVYKRDVLGEMDGDDRQYIQSGNHVAHGGNVKRDAELYSGINARHDFEVFKKLYGLHPAIVTGVATIDYGPTIKVLNKHATIVSSTEYSVNPEFHARFDDFIAALHIATYPKGYLENIDNNSSPVKEYWKFWDAVQNQVTKTG